MGAWHFPGTVLTDEDPALGVCGDDKRYMNGVFFLIEVDVQYYISYRCTIQRFTIFKGYIPFIVIIKDWLCSLYCTIYPCSLFYFLFLFLKYIYLFIYLFLAALGLRCCAQAFSSCSERGLLFVAVCGLLIVVASLVAEHRLSVHGLH